jgi:hypothetical protein
MRGTGVDLEVEIYATKLANETRPWGRKKIQFPKRRVFFLII